MGLLIYGFNNNFKVFLKNVEKLAVPNVIYYTFESYICVCAHNIINTKDCYFIRIFNILSNKTLSENKNNQI